MLNLSEQWAMWTMASREGNGRDPRKGGAFSVFMLQTPSVSQSYKHQTLTLLPHFKNICFMLSLIEDSCLIDPSLQADPEACRLRWEREKINLDPREQCCFQVYWIISLSLLNYGRTALCPKFEQGPCGQSSTSCGRQLCCSTRKSGMTAVLDQMA